MTNTELEGFVLWMAGAIDVVGEKSPDQETWDRIRAKVAEIVGGIVKDRLLAEKREQELRDLLKLPVHHPIPPYAPPPLPNFPPSWYGPSVTTTGTGCAGGVDPTWVAWNGEEKEVVKLLDK